MLPMIFFCIGCKKETVPPSFQNFLNFEMDGLQIKCDKNISASVVLENGTIRLLDISADWAAGSISLELNENQAITAGEYIFSADRVRRATLWLNLSPGQNTMFYAGDGGFANTLSGTGKITIAEINNEFVKGNFDFTTAIEYFSNSFKVVTNGTFALKFK